MKKWCIFLHKLLGETWVNYPELTSQSFYWILTLRAACSLCQCCSRKNLPAPPCVTVCTQHYSGCPRCYLPAIRFHGIEVPRLSVFNQQTLQTSSASPLLLFVIHLSHSQPWQLSGPRVSEAPRALWICTWHTLTWKEEPLITSFKRIYNKKWNLVEISH